MMKKLVVATGVACGLALATSANAADAEFCKAWFHGSNPNLNDRVPMLMLRDLPLSEIQPELVGAARLFAARPGTGSSA